MTGEQCLVTGAGGEIGFGLIEYLSQSTTTEVIALDLRSLSAQLASRCSAVYEGDILDWSLLEEISTNHKVSTIYHLASILSTQAEKDPFLAHRVNVEGTLHIIRLAQTLSERLGSQVKIVYPSSIAVYGMNDIKTKNSAGPVSEDEYCSPLTIYGSNKRYCERLGAYFTHQCQQYRSSCGEP
jgi:threonine 3-dehydrogenase